MKNINIKDFDDNEHVVSEYDLKRLALFNLTLDPIPEVSEIAGYSGALSNYYLDKSDELKPVFDVVNNSSLGKQYYAVLLEMFLLDKAIQDGEIKLDDVSARYNQLVKNKEMIFNLAMPNEPKEIAQKR